MKRFLLKLLIFLSAICLLGCNAVNRPDYESLDYQYDVEPVTAMFPFFQSIESVYRKSGSVGSRAPGPNSYECKVFFSISDDEYSSISEKYELELSTPDFPDGIDPQITGCLTFKWSTNDKLSKAVLAPNYVGNVYIDQINKIVYIEAEST